jgi:uncharacterized protein YgbK (DUF1537 family)
MNDANLVRFLQVQLSGGHNRVVGLISHQIVMQSPDAIKSRMNELCGRGISIAICDTIENKDLIALAYALRDAPFLTAASGLAMALPSTWGFQPSSESSRLPLPKGRKMIISGSCSAATIAQVEHFIKHGGGARFLDPARLLENFEDQVEEILAWADSCWNSNPGLPLLVYSTATPSAVESLHSQLGVTRCGNLIEQALSKIVAAVSSKGLGRLIVAGGETAGICARALGIQQMQIGPQIEPGVPWCHAILPSGASDGMHVAFKSGNFGSDEFFTKAFALLEKL